MKQNIKDWISYNQIGLLIILGAIIVGAIWTFFGNDGVLNIAILVITILAILLEQANIHFKQRDKDYNDIVKFLYYLSKKVNIYKEIDSYLKSIDYNYRTQSNILTIVKFRFKQKDEKA